MIKIIKRSEELTQLIRKCNEENVPDGELYGRFKNLSVIETSGFLDQGILEFDIFREDDRAIRKWQLIDFDELIIPKKSGLIQGLKRFITINRLEWDDIIGSIGKITIRNKNIKCHPNFPEIIQFIPELDEEFAVSIGNIKLEEEEYGK